MSQWLFPICKLIFKTTMALFSKTTVVGRENVPRHGPVIIASNHLSNIDPAIVAYAVSRWPKFLAKKELFDNWFFAFLLHSYGAYPVDRNRADLNALNWATKELKKGKVLILFPEGTRSRGQGLLKAKPGIAHLAALTGAPIVPVALTGSEPLQNVLLVMKPSATMTLTFGEPFVVDTSRRKPGREDLETISTEMMARIARMLPESYRGQYANALDTPMRLTVDLDSKRTLPAPTRVAR